MKRSPFLIIFIGTHLLFIILQIYKQNLFIDLSYQKQRKEKLVQELGEKKKELGHQHSTLANYTDIKEYASTQLGMQPVTLQQIRKLTNDQ